MIILGVLVLILVVVIITFILVTGSDSTIVLTWDAFNLQWQPTPALVFALGALTVALLGLSIIMIRSGVKRQVAKGQEMRRLRKLEQDTGGRRVTRTGDTPAREAGSPVRDGDGLDPGHDDEWQSTDPGTTSRGSSPAGPDGY